MTYKVVHWGTGGAGAFGLRGILSHPDLELVGVRVHNPDKVGKDAADLCGLDTPTGVVATDDDAALSALGADCLAYFGPGAGRAEEAVGDWLPYVAGGSNVVTTSVASLVNPPSAPPEVRDPLAAAVADAGVSVFATGIEPGFGSDLLPMALLAACDDVQEVRIQEIGDYSQGTVEWEMRDVFGFGLPLDHSAILFQPGVLSGSFGGIVELIADALGVTLDGLATVHETAAYGEDIDTCVGTIDAGTAAAVRFEVRGLVGGRPLIVLEHVNRMHPDAAPDWAQALMSDSLAYRVLITGRPNMQCELAFDNRGAENAGLLATAMRAINAIPAVCEAAPGLLSARDMPVITSRHVG